MVRPFQRRKTQEEGWDGLLVMGSMSPDLARKDRLIASRDSLRSPRARFHEGTGVAEPVAGTKRERCTSESLWM